MLGRSDAQDTGNEATPFVALIQKGPMSRFQIAAIAICVVLNMLDGFDVLVMAFVAPGVSADWQLSGARLGVLLSAGLTGMAIGSLLMAPWADTVGRRALVLLSVAMISVGMLLSWVSRGYMELVALRVLTGVGIGGILPTVNVIVSEYASDRWRNTAISIYAAGYPIGATLGGTIANVLIQQYGWRVAFLFGGCVSIAMLPIVWLQLPESPAFLFSRRSADALHRLNALLRCMHRPLLTALPSLPTSRVAPMNRWTKMLSGPLLLRTALICCAFFMTMAALYFINSWTPKLLASTGLTAGMGITGGVLFNLGGMIGTLAFGALCAWVALPRLILLFLGATAVAVGLFGYVLGSIHLALLLAVVMGGFINGAIAGLYALAAGLYATAERATGMGWALGIGRLGAILSPLVVGVLVDRNWRPADLYLTAVTPLLLALLAVWLLRARGTSPDLPR